MRTAHPLGGILPHAARVVMALTFVLAGLNGFLNFLPAPTTPIPAPALAFVGALAKTGYMFPMLAGVQLIAGALLLVNRFVPLALALLAPVVVNIAAFHVALGAPGADRAAILVVLELYLVWTHGRAYRPMLAPRTEPNPNSNR